MDLEQGSRRARNIVKLGREEVFQAGRGNKVCLQMASCLVCFYMHYKCMGGVQG